jgi:hypothetical protein
VTKLDIQFTTKLRRRCGDCQLCCKLLPVKSVAKLAGDRCSHQRHHKGCDVYARLMGVAPECKLWSCRWLVEDDVEGLSRPDRSHYVLDLLPDHITITNEATGEVSHVEVVQIWVDPRYPDAHRDPALRAFLERKAKDNIVGLVRYDNTRGLVIFPPELSDNRQWNEVSQGLTGKEHSLFDTIKALAP